MEIINLWLIRKRSKSKRLRSKEPESLSVEIDCKACSQSLTNSLAMLKELRLKSEVPYECPINISESAAEELLVEKVQKLGIIGR